MTVTEREHLDKLEVWLDEITAVRRSFEYDIERMQEKSKKIEEAVDTIQEQIDLLRDEEPIPFQRRGE